MRYSCSVNNSLIKNNVNGFLVDDADEDLSSKLSTLIEDCSLRERFGQNGINESKSFLPDNVYGKWVKLINDVINAS